MINILNNEIKKLNSKYFINVRKINNPKLSIILAYTGILCLFNGLNQNINKKFLTGKRKDWKFIKNYIYPVKIMNAIKNF